MSLQQSRTFWTVISVHRKIPVSVEGLQSEEEAHRREKLIRDQINLQDDETGVFEVQIPCSEAFQLI